MHRQKLAIFFTKHRFLILDSIINLDFCFAINQYIYLRLVYNVFDLTLLFWPLLHTYYLNISILNYNTYLYK